MSPVGGDSEGRMPGGDSRPTPDPTTLTTEQLERGLAALEKTLDARLIGMVQLREEEFKAIKLQLDLMEKQRLEQKSDTKAAVDAALTAQKDQVKEQVIASERSIAKSEAATSKQLEQLSVTFKTEIAAVVGGLNDVKDRVGRIESIKVGGAQAYNGLYMLAGFIVLLLAIVGAIAALRGGP